MYEQAEIQCPYCDETIAIGIDLSAGHPPDQQQYTEDCSVCCQPIVVTISVDDRGMLGGVDARPENG